MNQGTFLTAMGIINTLTDICCTLLPAFVVAKLQMPVRQKITVTSVFLGGIIAIIASILRIYYVLHRTETQDNVWMYFSTVLSGLFEVAIGLVILPHLTNIQLQLN